MTRNCKTKEHAAETEEINPHCPAGTQSPPPSHPEKPAQLKHPLLGIRLSIYHMMVQLSELCRRENPAQAVFTTKSPTHSKDMCNCKPLEQEQEQERAAAASSDGRSRDRAMSHVTAPFRARISRDTLTQIQVTQEPLHFCDAKSSVGCLLEVNNWALIQQLVVKEVSKKIGSIDYDPEKTTGALSSRIGAILPELKPLSSPRDSFTP